jgi:hypothetical protein
LSSVAPHTIVEDDWVAWEPALAQFSAASGLVVSAYDMEGRRRIGPFLQSPLSKMLAGSSLWHEDGDGTRFEQGLTRQAAQDGQASAAYCDELCVRAVPLTMFDVVYGAVVELQPLHVRHGMRTHCAPARRAGRAAVDAGAAGVAGIILAHGQSYRAAAYTDRLEHAA